MIISSCRKLEGGIMANEENVVKVEEQKKEPVNIWKVMLIGLALIVLIITLCFGIYNSEWFINQSLHIKKAEDIKLGKNITYNYTNKYEGNRLKTQLIVNNVDEKVMKIVNNDLEYNDYIVIVVYEDKDGFKISETKITKDDFIQIGGEKGKYATQSSIMIDKTNVRKINNISIIYREFLDLKYDAFMKKIDSKYRKAINDLLNF